jgi:hypothetical protein
MYVLFEIEINPHSLENTLLLRSDTFDETSEDLRNEILQIVAEENEFLARIALIEEEVSVFTC